MRALRYRNAAGLYLDMLFVYLSTRSVQAVLEWWYHLESWQRQHVLDVLVRQLDILQRLHTAIIQDMEE